MFWLPLECSVGLKPIVNSYLSQVFVLFCFVAAALYFYYDHCFVPHNRLCLRLQLCDVQLLFLLLTLLWDESKWLLFCCSCLPLPLFHIHFHLKSFHLRKFYTLLWSCTMTDYTVSFLTRFGCRFLL